MSRDTKALLVAAPTSGAGKTTITLGLLATLRAMSEKVQPFKVGPDYIDTAYHTRVAGRVSVNLDTWMTPPSFVRDTFYRHCQDADIAIIEGVMGLFDGMSGEREDGSSAHLAKLLGIPIILVVDAHACSRSVGAIVLGCQQYDPDLHVAGVIFNRVAGDDHFRWLNAAVKERCSIEVLGWIPNLSELRMPERQLGLVSVHECGLPENYLDLLTSTIRKHIRMERLIELAGLVTLDKVPSPLPVVRKTRIGIARDEVFCFYYEDNLRLLAEAGAELVFFSPLAGQELPDGLGGLYFGGGFPEEAAAKLAGNRSMLESVANFPGPVIAECGGLIYLCREFIDLDGNHYELAGRVPGSIEMTRKLQTCGYREVQLTHNTLIGPVGTTLRGHCFHWSVWRHRPTAGWGIYQSRREIFGYADDHTLASYFHLHLGSCLSTADHFIECCRRSTERLYGKHRNADPTAGK